MKYFITRSKMKYFITMSKIKYFAINYHTPYPNDSSKTINKKRQSLYGN